MTPALGEEVPSAADPRPVVGDDPEPRRETGATPSLEESVDAFAERFDELQMTGAEKIIIHVGGGHTFLVGQRFMVGDKGVEVVAVHGNEIEVRSVERPSPSPPEPSRNWNRKEQRKQAALQRRRR